MTFYDCNQRVKPNTISDQKTCEICCGKSTIPFKSETCSNIPSEFAVIYKRDTSYVKFLKSQSIKFVARLSYQLILHNLKRRSSINLIAFISSTTKYLICRLQALILFCLESRKYFELLVLFYFVFTFNYS